MGGHIWVGALAVDCFFAISGFLVAASFVRQGLVGFIVARALRIYPALIMCVLLTTFVMGPAVTTLPLDEYLTHSQTWQYLRTMTLWPRVYHYLPGVFENQPFSKGVNGSLWSLTAEVICYALLALIGIFRGLRGKFRANVVLILLLLIAYFDFSSIPLIGHKPAYMRLWCYFVLGALTWVNRAHIPLNPFLAIAACIAPFVGAYAGIFHIVFAPSIIYLVFFAAYGLPHIDLDRFGDISYGVYIYAWPVQQVVVWPGQTGYENAAIATPIVLALAAASWFLIEQPAILKRKSAETGIREMLRPVAVPFRKKAAKAG